MRWLAAPERICIEDGSVINRSGGLINGYAGILAVDNPVTVVDAGNIDGTSRGIALGSGGTIFDAGTISGAARPSS